MWVGSIEGEVSLVGVRGCAVVLVLVTVWVVSAKGPCVCGCCVGMRVDEGASWLSVRRVGVVVVVVCVVAVVVTSGLSLVIAGECGMVVDDGGWVLAVVG